MRSVNRFVSMALVVGDFFCTLPKTKMFSEQMVVCSDKPFPLRNGGPPSDGGNASVQVLESGNSNVQLKLWWFWWLKRVCCEWFPSKLRRTMDISWIEGQTGLSPPIQGSTFEYDFFYGWRWYMFQQEMAWVWMDVENNSAWKGSRPATPMEVGLSVYHGTFRVATAHLLSP